MAVWVGVRRPKSRDGVTVEMRRKEASAAGVTREEAKNVSISVFREKGSRSAHQASHADSEVRTCWNEPWRERGPATGRSTARGGFFWSRRLSTATERAAPVPEHSRCVAGPVRLRCSGAATSEVPRWVCQRGDPMIR